MTSRRWVYWLGATGAGACIALGAGHGVAAADTDSSDGADSISRSAESDSSPAAREASTQRAAAEDSDDSTDPATVPSSARHQDAKSSDASGAATPRDERNRVVTLHRLAAADDTEVSTSADDDATAVADADSDAPAAAVVEPEASAPDAIAPTSAPAETTPNRRSPGPAESDPLNTRSVLDGAAPADTTTPAPAAAPPLPTTAQVSAQVAPTQVTGVKTGHAELDIPVGTNGYTTRADWYFPTQSDGSVAATGVIWLQHGFLNKKSFVSALATTLSQQTNSIVVAPNIGSFPLRCTGCWLNGVPTQQAVASMFLGDRLSLNESATAAGLLSELPQDFILSGQSAGGGFATAVGGYYAADPTNTGSLRGVVMFDGFAFGGVVPNALISLDNPFNPFIPVYQVAAPPQLWNLDGATTAELVAARPGQFVGATLANGSHADAILGGNPIIDLLAQLVTKFSPPGNTAATYTLSTGWINDLYQGLGPTDGTGIYGAPDEYIVMGDTAAVVLAPAPIVDVGQYLGTWYEVGSVKQFFSIGLVNTKAVYGLDPEDGFITVANSGNYFVNDGPESTILGSAQPVNADDNRLNVTFFGPPSAKPPGNYWIVDLDPAYQWAIVSDGTGLSGFLLTRTPTVSADFYQELLNRASVKGVKGRITTTRQTVAG